MADIRLTAAPRLGGYDQTIGGLRLSEVSIALVSLAIPMGGEAEARAALASGLGLEMPEGGRSALSSDGLVRVIRMAPDQLMAAFDHPAPDAEPHLRQALGEAFYTTEQTDAWCALRLEGAGCRKVLERLIPLDVADGAFPVGAAHRTVMEHLGTLLIRESDAGYLLLSASSSAESFLHAVETSLHFVS